MRVLVACALFVLCKAYSAADKIKCKLNDSDCQLKIVTQMYNEIADNGISDIGLPKIDPFEIKNTMIGIFGLVRLTVVDGKIVGLKNCEFSNLKTDHKALRTTVDVSCDILHVDCHYKMTTLPILDKLTGGLKIHGDGNGTADFEKLLLQLDIALSFVKGNDGEYHIRVIPENSSYTFDITGNAKYSANNIFFGNQDISKIGVDIFNENWKMVTKAFGGIAADRALETAYEFVNKYLSTVPTKDLISEDLSMYVKN